MIEAPATAARLSAGSRLPRPWLTAIAYLALYLTLDWESYVEPLRFLDVKVEGVQRRMDGRMRDVWIYQRDFRPVQGLMMPFVQETVVDRYQARTRWSSRRPP